MTTRSRSTSFRSTIRRLLPTTAGTWGGCARHLYVLGNDSDADGPLAVLAVDGTAITAGNTVAVAHGSVTLNADGTLTFAPAEDFNGETSFSYQTRVLLHYQFFDREDTNASTRRKDPDQGRHRGTATDSTSRRWRRAQRQHRQFRHPLHRLDPCRGRRQLHVLHHLGRRLGALRRRRVGGEQRLLAGRHRALRRRDADAGTHAIEIRYFEGGGGEELQVSVSGPDTASIKTALLDSALVGTATANVDVRR